MPGSGSGPGKRTSRKAGTAPRADFHRPPKPLIMGFIDTMRSQGHAVESVCRVLREQGCQVAARTYRAWRARRPAARTHSDAQVIDAIKDTCWRRDESGTLRLTPEGLYGRRKLTAHLRRGGLEVPECTVVRCMKTLNHKGIRRSKGVRTTIPAKDGNRAGDLLNRNFTAPAPNRVWVTDFERHEALLDRAVVKGHRPRLVAAGREKLRAA